MSVVLSKTDYILYRECPQNVWYKIYKPDVYFTLELSDFEKNIIETGNEVEVVARKMYPGGTLVEGRGKDAQEKTKELIDNKTETIFQPVFLKDGFLAAVDILRYDKESDAYQIYEIKASNNIKEKVHIYDLAFQVVLLRKIGIKISAMYLMHLNSDYVRDGELDIFKLFKADDMTYEVEKISEAVSTEMQTALDYINNKKEPEGSCVCIYKGRSGHCTTFCHSNPHVPTYSIHDISRIGTSKRKIRELIDKNVLHIHEVPEDFDLSEAQRNQVDTHIKDEPIINQAKIVEELEKLEFPLYFIDYEASPVAIPLFDGFSPYQPIPFQYSLHILDKPSGELKHKEFLHTEFSDPSKAFAESLQKNIGDKGNLIVWSKQYESMINRHLARRIPEFGGFIEDINKRMYDLRDIFTKQHHVHKDFKGSTSIKKIMPVIAPDLSYKKLGIQEGGTAAASWVVLTDKNKSQEERDKIKKDLLEYCKMDTYAMVRIYEELDKL